MNFLLLSLTVGAIAFDPRALQAVSDDKPTSGKAVTPGGYGSTKTEPEKAQAPQSGSSANDSKTCPEVWTKIAAEFKKDFAGCNNLARSAIRFAFHDSGAYSSKNEPYAPASGGADGSLLLNEEEISREAEQSMKSQFRDPYLLPAYKKYKDQGVSAADIVQFAGSVGVRSCKIEHGYPGLVIRTVSEKQTDKSRLAET